MSEQRDRDGIAFRSRENAGFTVVELVVAAGITIALAATMIAIVSGVMSSWNRSSGTLVATNQAKLAVDQLAVDLEGAVFRNDGNVWLAASMLESNGSASVSDSVLTSDHAWVTSGSQTASFKPHSAGSGSDSRTFVLNENAIADCRFGVAGVWLRFFTTKNNSNTSIATVSAPVAIAYQIVRRNVSSSSSSEVRYALFRSEVRSTTSGSNPGTFETGYNLDPSTGGYITADASVLGNVGNIVKPRLEQAIANNVIDFGVRFYVRAAGAERLIFPATAAGLPSDSGTTVPDAELAHLSTSGVYDSSDPYRHRFPEIAEIQMRILTDEGARLIANLEAGKLSGNWWDIALANSRVYVRRVELKGQQL